MLIDSEEWGHGRFTAGLQSLRKSEGSAKVAQEEREKGDATPTKGGQVNQQVGRQN